MTILKTQKFDMIEAFDFVKIIIYIDNGLAYYDYITAVNGKQNSIVHLPINYVRDRFTLKTLRGVYTIYLTMIKPNLIWFAKKKNGKIVERHIWKISDYMEETK